MTKKPKRSLSKARKGTLKIQAYEDIKRMILSGKLRAGQKLVERSLTTTLNVSRTPVREALSRLIQEGLVINEGRNGHFVHEMDVKFVEDIYGLREVLERYALERALRYATPEFIKELERTKTQLRRFARSPTQSREEVKLGLRIHELIAQAAQDSLLSEMLQRLYDRMHMLIWIDVLYADEARLTRSEHVSIIDAMRKGDRRKLIKVSMEHLRRSKENVLRVVRALQNLP